DRDSARHASGADVLRAGRRGGDLPPAGPPFLPGGGRGPVAAAHVPRGGPRPRRGPAAAVPHAVLGRTPDVQRHPRSPAAADAARPVQGRPGRARRVAQAHARRPRRARPVRGARAHAVGLPDVRGRLHDQLAGLTGPVPGPPATGPGCLRLPPPASVAPRLPAGPITGRAHSGPRTPDFGHEVVKSRPRALTSAWLPLTTSPPGHDDTGGYGWGAPGGSHGSFSPAHGLTGPCWPPPC